MLSSPRRDKPRVAIKTYAQSEFIITLQHIERLQDAPPMRFDLIEVILVKDKETVEGLSL